MQVEHSILVLATAERIFRIYENVAVWHTWDPDTRRASLEGPFAVGSRGSLTPTKGNTVPMLITKVKPNSCFTVESKIPLFRMVFEHELVAQGNAVKVTHRVTFSGLLSMMLGRMLVKQLNMVFRSPLQASNAWQRVQPNPLSSGAPTAGHFEL
ncbi:polyketide cyclase [Hydrogenophaga defluvii]|uniref:Polyketide cyclase n=1 Tax=Hydrogenophaga defluvii TaxID=249410 RepID=A0ABW2S5Z3_9BURK